MRMLVQPGERSDVPCRLESRVSGLAIRSPPFFLVCCNQNTRNGEPNTPSHARVSGVLLGSESMQTDAYAPRTIAVLPLVDAPTRTSPTWIGTNVLHSSDRDAGPDSVNIVCSIRSFSMAVRGAVYLERQIRCICVAVMLPSSWLF